MTLPLRYVICSMLVLMAGAFQCQSQILLQLEKYKVDKPQKFYIGQEITFKMRDYPDEWRKEKIERLLYDEQLIVTDMGLVPLGDISHFRTYNMKVYYAAAAMQSFAAVYMVYGGIAMLATDFRFTGVQLILGGGAYVGGWLLKKLFYKNTYALGDKHRLRILDISWPEPTG